MPGNLQSFDFLSPSQGPDEMGRLGPYRVLKLLGRGGMGVVFLAEDPHLQRTVALKAMLPELARKPVARERFLREARAAAKIEHDHIVTIFEVGEDRGVPFLTMQLLKGMSLDDFLKKATQTNKPVTLGQTLKLGREIATGLAAAHERGLIHRDIKPENIWLDATAGGRVKILDFGLARPVDTDANLTQSGMIVGTPAYMAPEQARGELVDGRADLFSLGCVLYRLCTGRLPWQGDNPVAVLMAVATEEPPPVAALNPGLPPKLAQLVMQLLAKSPQGRPPSAKSVVKAIQSIKEIPVAVLVDTGANPTHAAATEAPAPQVQVRSRFKKLLVPILAVGMLGLLLLLVLRPASPEKQVEAVHAELKRRNGSSPEKVMFETEDGIVTQLKFASDNITDISPVRALVGLKSLRMMPSHPSITSPLSDLAPLKGLQLTLFQCDSNNISDLAPLKGMPMTALWCARSKVTDLSPLQGMRLEIFQANVTPISDISVLKGMPLTRVGIGGTRVTDLSPLRGMALVQLNMSGLPVTDLPLLKDMPLNNLTCGFRPEHVEMLRSIKTLETLNGKPAGEVLK